MKKGFVICILVSFHFLEILFLLNNLVVDQGKRETGNVESSSFPECCTLWQVFASNPLSWALCGFFIELTPQHTFSLSLSLSSSSLTCACVLLMGMCIHGCVCMYTHTHIHTPSFPPSHTYITRDLQLAYLLMQVKNSLPIPGQKAPSSAAVNLVGLLQQHSAVGDRDL